MAYLPRTADRRADVRRVMASTRSVIMTGTVYNTGGPSSFEPRDSDHAQVARYACADDYHVVLARRLDELVHWMHGEHSEPFETRAYVDTGPVQERVYAQYAGLGWIGKNTCVINPERGSWILLAEILCSLPLEPDPPGLDQCGTCTLCLDACPTGAIVEPWVLDSTRCISYQTIEYRGTVPDEQRAGIGNHLFGCDICQEVCPWNAMPAVANDRWPSRAALCELTLSTVREKTDRELSGLIDGAPLTRAGVKGLRRNLAIAVENSAGPVRSKTRSKT